LIKDQFVAVSVETAVVKERVDAEGMFLEAAVGPGFFPTSSGYMECVSASGRHLGRGDAPEKALVAFRRLPKEERDPGAVQVPVLTEVDERAAPPAPPPGGLVLKIHGRILTREEDGRVRASVPSEFPLLATKDRGYVQRHRFLLEASPDFFWLTEDEWRALIPEDPVVDQTVPVPEAIVRRICRWHLIPRRLYAEGGEWSDQAIGKAEMTLRVTAVTDDVVRMQCAGEAHLGTTFVAEGATTPNGPLLTGYAPRFFGEITYDRGRRAITRFDLLALGDVWGRLGDHNGKSWLLERPGRHPLGFSFQLANPEDPGNRLVPSGRASKIKGGRYLGER
jgi:hypothetical protein